MSNKMLVTVKLDQRLMMSQQLRQAITLLQYNTLDLKQLVQQAIETNLLLELEETEQSYTAETMSEDANYHQHSADVMRYKKVYGEDSDNALENYAIPKSLRSHLLEQTLLCHFSETEQQISEAIIDAIDDRGYLTMSLEEIQQMLPFPANLSVIQHVLQVIKTFEPTGVGSSNVRECLLLQLDAMLQKDEIWQAAYTLIDKAFDQIAMHNKKLAKQFNLAQSVYDEALILLRTLNPDPGRHYFSEIDMRSEPELYVEKIKNQWCVFLADSVLTNVKINAQYQSLIKENKKHGSYGALKQELEEARFLLKGLKRRNETLLSVAKYIIEKQVDFLDHGETRMKAMTIHEVAEALEIHESTVSRITTGKYIATPRGVFELKYFFPSHVSTRSGDTCSANAVQALIKGIIAQETAEHVYSDAEIAEKLKEQGINIARRTVAKYREALRILPSYQRC